MHRLDYPGMVMSQEKGPVASEVIDVPVPVNVPFVGTPGSFDIDSVGLQVPGIVSYAARQQVRCFRKQLLGSGRFLSISGNNRGFGLGGHLHSNPPVLPLFYAFSVSSQPDLNRDDHQQSVGLCT